MNHKTVPNYVELVIREINTPDPWNLAFIESQRLAVLAPISTVIYEFRNQAI